MYGCDALMHIHDYKCSVTDWLYHIRSYLISYSFNKTVQKASRGLVHRLELAEVLSPAGFVTPVNESSSAPNSIVPLELL